MYLWRKHVTKDWLGERSDALIARLGIAIAIIEQPGKTRTLVQVSCGRRSEAKQLQREFGGRIEKLRTDWLQQFARKSRTKPLRIGSRLIVSRGTESKLKGARTIVIPAEAAFGTGEHATTAMCLRMLERTTRPLDDWTMLDAGTGSGILAIAGSCFGAKRIVAIDNDPIASSTAQRNARTNRARNIEFQTGDVLKQKLAGKFDIITANLFSEILIAALPIWSRRLARDGHLILSGVLRSQEPALLAALRRNGFRADEIRRRGKWIALLASRAPGK
ncbi:MAG TPA: 50S ribosomal protein L11 methyltransferase [Chthoniobacterales bacterium]|nr:50S ribosomal protein L11 methyltransferase [Chthoniobacterales bacterium]